MRWYQDESMRFSIYNIYILSIFMYTYTYIYTLYYFRYNFLNLNLNQTICQLFFRELFCAKIGRRLSSRFPASTYETVSRHSNNPQDKLKVFASSLNFNSTCTFVNPMLHRNLREPGLVPIFANSVETSNRAISRKGTREIDDLDPVIYRHFYLRKIIQLNLELNFAKNKRKKKVTLKTLKKKWREKGDLNFQKSTALSSRRVKRRFIKYYSLAREKMGLMPAT